MIIGLYLLLCIIGVVNIYAADFNPVNGAFFDLSNRSGKQFLWLGASLVIGLGIMSFDSKFFRTMSPVIYGIITLLLFAVIFLARDVKGARAWIDIGPFKLQPAEFAKFATALFLSAYLGNIGSLKKVEESSIEDIGRRLSRFIRGKKVFSISDIDFYGQVLPILIIFLPMALILGQDDTGSALVFCSF